MTTHENLRKKVAAQMDLFEQTHIVTHVPRGVSKINPLSGLVPSADRAQQRAAKNGSKASKSARKKA